MEITVIGGGDAALDYAVTLSAMNTVTVHARGDFSKAVPHLLAKAAAVKSITLCPNSIPGDSLQHSTVVVAAGRTANTGFVQPELLASPPEDGSFHLCGDCDNGIYRQTAIAVGNGVEAAMKTVEYLREVRAV